MILARPAFQPLCTAGRLASASRAATATRTLRTSAIAFTKVHTAIRAPKGVPATLHLKTGESFAGESFGAPTTIFGETVFTTSITSYTESLTDPSYQGQLLTFTQPLMGNYGVPDNSLTRSPVGDPRDVDVGSFLESVSPQAAGVIVSDLCDRYSHFEAVESLSQWCARYGVPGIRGIDTRALTTLLRDQGSTLGAIKVGEGHEQPPALDSYIDPMAMNLIQRVSTKTPYVVHPVGGASAARVHIALLDFGSKANILRSLLRQGASVTVLPWNYDFADPSIRDKFDGLFLSNGPGSPYSIPDAVQTVKRVIDEEWGRPVFGICMGNQILGLAAGLKAYRMKFGNRGHNQPVVSLSTAGKSVRAGRVYITSQNHGYALEWDHDANAGPEGTEGKWPKEWEPWFVNANDSSIEGIRSGPTVKTPSWAVQFHPEHAGGPEDCQGMFEDWIFNCEEMRQREGRQVGTGLGPDVKAEPQGCGIDRAQEDASVWKTTA